MKQQTQIDELLKSICFQCMKIRKNHLVCEHCGYDYRQFEQHPQFLNPGYILKKKYLLGIPLASDGFNNTYMAYDITTHQRKVVKEYFPVGLAGRSVDRRHVRPNSDEAQNELFVFGKRAFLKEAMTLSDIRMQHVLHVVNYFSENNTAYMVQDYIDGTDLSRHLVIKGGKITLHEALEIILPILSTLHKLHKIFIFHYNLTLAKIMIVPMGYPVIFGFGQTKQLLAKQSLSFRQTIQYNEAPPEQFLTDAKMGAWSDVYSCGIIFYQLITGKTPPTARDRLKNDQWVPANQVQGVNISVELSDVIDNAVGLDTNERYKSTHELSRAIKTKMPKEDTQKNKSFYLFFSIFIMILFALIGFFHFFSQNNVQPIKKTMKRPLIIESVKREKINQMDETIHLSRPIEPVRMPETSASQPKHVTQVQISNEEVPSPSQSEPFQEQTTLSKPQESQDKSLRICGDQELCNQLMPSLVHHFFEKSGIQNISRKTVENGNIQIYGQQKNQGYLFAIESVPTTKAYQWLLYGQCDMVISGQRIQKKSPIQPVAKPDETDLRPTEYVIAMDGIVAMVHPSNPIQNLQIQEIQKIFRGQDKRWPFSDTSQEIHIYTPKSSSDLYQVFQKKFLDGKKLHATREFEDLDSLSKYLHKDPNGIGLCSLPFIYDNQPLAIADHEIDPVRPGYFSVSIDSYLMIRNIYLYTVLVSAEENTLPFVTFIQSSKGQEVVKRCGYVDCTIKALGSRRELWQKPFNKAVFNKLVKITRQTQKLSMNFYFKSNDYQLTGESSQKLKQLISWLRRKAGMLKIYVIGYSDSRGAYRQNCLVALKRAETVAREMKISGIYVDEIVTACEEFPIASNQTNAGRFKNRRVEIWVKPVRMP